MDNVLEIEKEGMFVGITTMPECWENPMNILEFMRKEEKNE